MSCVLGYEAAAGDEAPERVWVAQPGRHRVSAVCKEELLSAIHELKPRKGARLLLFGTDVAELDDDGRHRLMRRVGFVPSNGGLMSTLNAWENISLPVAYHTPQKLAGAHDEVRRLLAELGGVDDHLLAKLPEDMTLYERRVAAFVRALLERPELLVCEHVVAGLGPTKRKRAARFAEIYQASCPGGTFLQFDA
jgi:ABC-type transporter Mla maintaining outer membrane lipid asymmetry ATPase subunit MlaF